MYIFSLCKLRHHMFFLLKILWGGGVGGGGGGGGGWGVGSFRSPMIYWIFLNFFIHILRNCPVLTGSFPLSYRMEQLVAYEEGEVTSQDDQQQSGKALPIAVNTSKAPEVVPVGVLDLLTSSSSFLICQLSWQTLLPWTGLSQVPRLLWSPVRTNFDIQAACPWPLHL